MGTLHHATCQSCGYHFDMMMEGGWAWYNKVCKTCGTLHRIPRYAMYTEDESLQGTELVDSNAMKAYLSNRSLWRRGPSFSDREREVLQALTAHCGCEGELIMEPPGGVLAMVNGEKLYRCPQCRSNDLKYEVSYLAFD